MSRRPAPREAFIDGIALWTPALPGWAAAAAALRGEPGPGGEGIGLPAGASDGAADGARQRASARPAPSGLAASERRRAPDSVLVALQVAEQAVAMSGHAAAALPSIFTSAHGDLPIIDAMLRTLAHEPQLLSPTRFHHSVHNAPSGYWAMASRCHAASTALAAFDTSFGVGLLEALVQVASDDTAVLLAGCDTEAGGPLASVNASRGLLGVALVLAPRAGARTQFRLHWHVDGATAAATPLRSAAARALAANALADALPLFEVLAAGGPAAIALRCGADVALRLSLQPWRAAG